MTPPKRRFALPEGTTMSAWQAAQERATPEAALVAGSCPYEADQVDAEAWQAIGFYPSDDPAPPF